MFKHLLIPTDGSELSDKAVERGVALAKAMNARVTGLHAMPATFAIHYSEVMWMDPQIEDSLRKTAHDAGKKYLDRLDAKARAAGVACECLLVENDMPWKAIVEAAKTKQCDLILMAAHGRRGLAALVVGSETNKVLTHSTIPVLVYR